MATLTGTRTAASIQGPGGGERAYGPGDAAMVAAAPTPRAERQQPRARRDGYRNLDGYGDGERACGPGGGSPDAYGPGSRGNRGRRHSPGAHGRGAERAHGPGDGSHGAYGLGKRQHKPGELQQPQAP